LELEDWVIEKLPDGLTRVLPSNKRRWAVARASVLLLLVSIACFGLARFVDGAWASVLVAAGVAAGGLSVPLWLSNVQSEWRVGEDLVEVRHQSFLTGLSARCFRAALLEIHGFGIGDARRTTMLFLCPRQLGQASTHLATGNHWEVRWLANVLADLTGWSVQERIRDG